MYQEYGLYFGPGNNDVEAGLLKVNSYIERGKWIILKDRCPNLAREGIRYRYPEVTMDDKKNPDEKPVQKDDHAMDSMRYGFMRLPDDPELLKTYSANPPTRYSHDDDDDWDDEYVEDDYLSYV